MAVELKNLYEEAAKKYDIKLCTHSCFGKKISWIHMVESLEFVPLLHGNELVFNSGLNYESKEWLKEFIEMIYKENAGGFIIALKDGHELPEEIISYCNQIRLPLFAATWETPYIDIMRMFSEILLRNEQRETNLIAAFKNAIYYPKQEKLYVGGFESNGFFQGISYTTIILSCHTYNTETGNTHLKRLEEELRYLLKKSIIYEKNDILVILTAGYQSAWVRKGVSEMCRQDVNVYAGVGITVSEIKDIHKSYETALVAYNLTKTALPKNCLIYEELGVYKILTDFKESGIYPHFVEEVLGALINYDKKNDTDYVHILEMYFENECSILNAAKALYCHKNTLTYKMNKIKEILGYDILTNENRTRIMLSFYILRLGEDYFEKM